MIRSYYPPTNDGRADWWQNVVNIGSAQLIALGFLSSQVSAILADAMMAVYLYRTLPLTYEEFGKRVTGFIHTYLTDPDGTSAPTAPPVPSWPVAPGSVLAGIEARREKWVQQAKHAALYDPLVHGAVLRIEPTGTPFDAGTYKAEIVSATNPGPSTVLAKFRKAGGAIDGLAFTGRRLGTGPFGDLGRFTATPASLHLPIATPGTAEVWELQGQALIKDALVGFPSDILQVVVRG